MHSPIGAQLTPTWRVLTALAWAAGFFAYAAIWQASVQLGIGTWWIGPRAEPTPALVRVLPFIICLGVCLLVAYGVRRVPAIGLGAAALLLVGAIPDFSRSTSLALTEVVVALTLLLVSALSLTGVVAGSQTRVSSPGADSSLASGPEAAWGTPDPRDRVTVGDHTGSPEPGIGEAGVTDR